MRTKDEGNGRHQIECPDSSVIHEHETEPDTGTNSDKIQQIARWQRQRFAINDSRQFAKGNDRTSCCNRANKDAKEDFDLVNDDLGPDQPGWR